MKVHEASESDEDPIEWGPDALAGHTYHKEKLRGVQFFLNGVAIPKAATGETSRRRITIPTRHLRAFPMWRAVFS
jgi:hypothetical protein